MRRVALIAWLLLASVSTGAAADPKDPLAQARTLYNERQFDAAIAAADEEGRRTPERADSADLIVARAYLERFRESAMPEDLTHARERLRRVNPTSFGMAERVEYTIGLGEALYFDDAAGAAADIFETVLVGPELLAPEARERVLDWWATALDREARPKRELERQAIYQRIKEGMHRELTTNPTSGVALYWLSAAARGLGDLEAAWHAAQSGWVRAPLTTDQGAALRADLERLVQRVIIPERAKSASQPPETLRLEWEQFKERWQK